MSHHNLFVFDIETVPDTLVVPKLTGFTQSDVNLRRDELNRYHLNLSGGKNTFPRQPFHQVVAISFIVSEIHREGSQEKYLLRELRSGGKEESSERDLIIGFYQYLEKIKPRLVTFNGRSFDLSVLKYRAMLHGVSATYLYNIGDKWNSYTSRYSDDWHCDLAEVLSDYGASIRPKLNEICSVLGFPGKLGVDGSKVSKMFDAGKIREIREYCELDVLNTYLVYLRYMHHRGTLSTSTYNHCINDIRNMLEDGRKIKPHYSEFIDAWSQTSDNKFLLD